VAKSNFIFWTSFDLFCSSLYNSQFNGDVISKYSLDFFVIFGTFCKSSFVSKKSTILLKISQAQVAQLTHFILLASLLPAQTQIM
jgi:hypothetical protein